MTELEGWLLNKLKEVKPETEQQDLYTGKITISGAWAMYLISEWHNKQQQQVKNLTIPVVMPSAIEQFNCRFHHIQEMVANKGITKENLISVQMVEHDKENGDLYKVVHWA